MRITVRAEGHLKQFRPDNRPQFDLELPDGATVLDLIKASGIPWDEVFLVSVDGQQASDDQTLTSGSEVWLLPPMEGG